MSQSKNQYIIYLYDVIFGSRNFNIAEFGEI